MAEERICIKCDEWMVLRNDVAGTSRDTEQSIKFWECPSCGGEEDYG